MEFWERFCHFLILFSVRFNDAESMLGKHVIAGIPFVHTVLAYLAK